MASKGRRRLSMLLCGLSSTACTVLMVAFVLLYGTPYNPMWWWVMAAILVVVTLLPLSLVPAIEWVITGYRSEKDG